MTTFLYAASASVDGRIAGPDGDMSWLLPHMGADPVMERLMPDLQALLVGRRTFDGDDPHAGDPEKEGPLEGQWEGAQILLTHRPPRPEPEGITVTTDLDAALSACRAAAPEGIVSILGADVARQCFRAQVVDLVLVNTVPVLLGGGTPLLSDTMGPIDLELLEQEPSAAGHSRLLRVVHHPRG
ncbi:dihydrofolate reductase family protein [Nesterenkonia xinjiangensis]|uniref:Dihydrofolate reductase n=1 Tax=Nesterenkonia xinjiangensis TaxID=225327 RepID=A0A7Z0KAN0_9MICC|nr:dihydrofolate reductase family protein [Nesterenkonia xinjiangensis]NYJ79053.1 dihydrofolate reductase [Nesterenkonia xinjiangensis]